MNFVFVIVTSYCRDSWGRVTMVNTCT